MKKILNSIWNFLLELAEARQDHLRKTNYRGWY